MRLVFTRLELIPAKLTERTAILVDQLAEHPLAQLGIQPHFQVKVPEILELEGVKEQLDSGGYQSIAAFGGWAAVSAARVLAITKRKRLSLRESLFEHASPSIPVIAVPFDLGLCIPLSEITLLLDSVVPVYYILRMPLTAVWIPLDRCPGALLQNPLEAEALHVEAELLGLEPPDLSSCSAVARFCHSYTMRGPGPLLLATASIAALAGAAVETVLKAILDVIRGGECGEWLKRIARRKLDLLAEHAWSYYSPCLVRLGVSSSYNTLTFFRQLLANCL